MIEAGILDPVKVTRSALQNANSVASTLLTTESVVATIKSQLRLLRLHLIWAECINQKYKNRNILLVKRSLWRIKTLQTSFFVEKFV